MHNRQRAGWFVKCDELIIGIEVLAARSNIFNVSLCLGEDEGVFASNIGQCPSLSTHLPRTTPSADAFLSDGLP